MDTPDQGHTARPRNRQGQYTVRPGTAERDARACRLRTLGMSYDQIANELGFRDRSGARRAVQRALTAVVREDAGELAALEAERLDDLARVLNAVLRTRHYAVTPRGALARNPDTGELLADYGPVIAAARELRMISESRRRLFGLDAPAKARIEVIDDAAVDAEMLRIAAKLDEFGDHDAAADARQAVGGTPCAIGQ